MSLPKFDSRSGEFTEYQDPATCYWWAAIVAAALGAAAQVKAGKQQNVDMQAQARLSEVQAEREAIAGIQEGNDIRRDLLRRLASNAAIGGASGLSLDGSFTTVNEELQQDAERQLNISRSNANVRRLSKYAEAEVLRTRGAVAEQSGKTSAVISLFGAASSFKGGGSAPASTTSYTGGAFSSDGFTTRGGYSPYG